MKTFAAILKGVGGLTLVVGFLTVINTIFSLHLSYKGTALPEDMGSAVMFFIFGAVTGVTGFFLGMGRR